jgi:hypothetical protein
MTPAHLAELKTELSAGLRQGVLYAAAVLVLVSPPNTQTAAPPAQVATTAKQLAIAPPHHPFHDPAFEALSVSTDARQVVDWIAESGDNRDLPYVVLDKRDARIYVFTAAGRFVATSPVLLGYTPGDDSVAGIGTRPIADVRPEERTTPAGRFVSAPGKNASNEDVIWVDYDDAVSMHRVRPTNPKEQRLQRLASPDPSQRRISYGCINVPVAFFNAVLWPRLGTRAAVIYVLPEVKDLREVFDSVPAPTFAPTLKTARSRQTDTRL